MSRVDAVRIAIDERTQELGHDPVGAAPASEAFFPVSDGPQLALDARVSVLVQLGRSKRDHDARTVETAGAAMVFTDPCHFRH